MLSASCCRPSEVNKPPPQLEPPSYAAVAEAHNARIDQLARVYARGVIELHWSDQDGRHFEQGDVDLWIALPHRTALNIEKFGQRILWLGSDEQHHWLFDFREDDSVLYLGTNGEPTGGQGAGHLPIQPHTLLTLCGLSRLGPSVGERRTAVKYDAHHDAWVVTLETHTQSARLYLDRHTLLPVWVEALSPDGRILFHSELAMARYDSVAIAGAPAVHRPKFPTLVDIFSADDTDTPAIKLAVRSPTDEVQDHYFDLKWLTDAFAPDRTEIQKRVSTAP